MVAAIGISILLVVFAGAAALVAFKHQPPAVERSPSGSSKQLPTLANLRADVARAAEAKSAPDLAKSIPPLDDISTHNTLPGMPSECYTQSLTKVPSNARTLCAFGDRTSSKSIYIFGDSQAAMWLNALNWIAMALHYKIIFTAHTGCPPWPGQKATDNAGDNESGCVSYVKSELALLTLLRPTVVIPAGDGWHDGTGNWATESQIAKSIEQLRHDAAPGKFFLLGPIPMFSTDTKDLQPAECIAAYANDIQKCEFSPAQMIDPVMAGAYKVAAKSAKFPYVSVQQLFCTSTRCAVIVSNHLVYEDADHAIRTYMLWVASALQTLIVRDL